jgi:hypothetical protein
MITATAGQLVENKGWKLVDRTTRVQCRIGDTVTDFRGDTAVLAGGSPPHKPSSSGFAYTQGNRELYVGVFGLEWVKDKPVPADPKLLKAALAIGELAYSLDNIATDDKQEIAEYSDEQIVDEAVWVLSCFHESGHINNTSLTGGSGPEERKWARCEVRKLNTFIAKYGDRGSGTKLGAAQK